MKQTTKPEQAKHRSKIGGQALIEGVMMKGVHTGAMACRLPDGTIDVETWEEHNGKEMPWYRKCPFVRGSFNFVISMRDGYRCLMKSAEKQMTEEEKEKLERNSALCGLTQSEYVRQLCRGIHPKPKPPDVFWRLMDELYKAHSDLKECTKYEPSALELCTEIERLVLDLQEAI